MYPLPTDTYQEANHTCSRNAWMPFDYQCAHISEPNAGIFTIHYISNALDFPAAVPCLDATEVL